MAKYHHYVPQFVLKEFLTPRADNPSVLELNVYDRESRQYSRKGKSRFAGETTLYRDPKSADPLHIEKAFSTLETEFSKISKRVSDACEGNQDSVHISLPEKTTLCKFIVLSEQRLNMIKEIYAAKERVNNRIYQMYLDAAEGGTEENTNTRHKQVWLKRLHYLLGASHTDLMTASGHADALPDVERYGRLFSSLDLQVWKAGGDREFFLSDRFVEKEGPVITGLWPNNLKSTFGLAIGWEAHIWMPLSPKAVIVFCSRYGCQEAYYEDGNHFIPLDSWKRSSLVDAPHNAPILESIRQGGSGKDTEMLRVAIAELPEAQHRVLEGCILTGSSGWVIYRKQATIEAARVSFMEFSAKDMLGESWIGLNSYWRLNEAEGARFPKHKKGEEEGAPETRSLATMLPVEGLFGKEKLSWSRNLVAASYCLVNQLLARDYKLDPTTDHVRTGFFHQVLIRAYEHEFPKDPSTDHGCPALDFKDFAWRQLSEADFKSLMAHLENKGRELQPRIEEAMKYHRGEADKYLAAIDGHPERDNIKPSFHGYDLECARTYVHNPTITKMFERSWTLSILMWLCESRQDILGQFMEEIAATAPDA